MSYTAQEKHREIMREMKLRQQLYPRWVETGKLSRKDADHQIDILKAIAADYATQMQREQLL